MNDKTPQGQDAENPNDKKGLTPHELVERHMQNPDEPITEEDMENMIVGTIDEVPVAEREDTEGIPLTEKEKKQAHNLANNLEEDSTGTAYKANF